jgi:hypothetical protein
LIASDPSDSLPRAASWLMAHCGLWWPVVAYGLRRTAYGGVMDETLDSWCRFGVCLASAVVSSSTARPARFSPDLLQGLQPRSRSPRRPSVPPAHLVFSLHHSHSFFFVRHHSHSSLSATLSPSLVLVNNQSIWRLAPSNPTLFPHLTRPLAIHLLDLEHAPHPYDL